MTAQTGRWVKGRRHMWQWCTAAFICSAGLWPQAVAQPMPLGTNFIPPGWGGWSLERGNYTDFFAETWHSVSGDEPVFKPEFEQEVAIYTGGFRWMEATAVNRATSNEFHASGRWQDRKQKSDPEQYEPVCYEYQMHLSNRLHQDYWVNVPHTADDDYFTQLATLIHSTLDPSLKCYVEWGNEIWNDAGGFEGGPWAIAKANALWGTDPNTIHSRAKYSTYRSLQMFAKFEEVFGAQASSRLVKVLGGWLGHDYTEVQLATLADAQLNPGFVRAVAYALAAYMGGALDGASATVLQDIAAEMANYLSTGSRFRTVRSLVTAQGMRMVAYECGLHVTNNAEALLANPGIYQWVKTYYDTMSHHYSVMFHYNHVGDPPWGAKLYVGQSESEAHVYRALKDWLAANPLAVALTPRAMTAATGGCAGWMRLVGSAGRAVEPGYGPFTLDGSCCTGAWSAGAGHGGGRAWALYIVPRQEPTEQLRR